MLSYRDYVSEHLEHLPEKAKIECDSLSKRIGKM